MDGAGATNAPPQRALLRQLARPAWLYPFKARSPLPLHPAHHEADPPTLSLQGIGYFLLNPFLHPLLRARLLPCLLLSLLVYSQLFLWTYLPQVAFLALFHGAALCWLNGAFLVLGEGAVVVALLFEAFLADETQVDVFDAVLVQEGLEDLVSKGRVLRAATEGSDNNARERLGKPLGSAVYAPFSLRQLLEFGLLLPLNLIPVAGTPAFLLMTGWRAGPFHHWRYFRLLGLTRQERREAIRRRQLRYTWFGTSALVLQLVPGLSMFFLMSTAAGAALWVVELEEAKRLRERRPGAEYVDDLV